MRKRHDLKGLRFGRLLVLERVEDLKRMSRWRCLCDCGKEKIATTVRLRNKQCTSCGCKQREETGNRFRKHGYSYTYEYKLWKYAKKRSIQIGKDFNIHMTDILIPASCPILEIPLVRSTNGKPTNNSPSLDRIDSSKGYVKGNIRVISMRANRLKQDSTIPELQNIIRYMEGKI